MNIKVKNKNSKLNFSSIWDCIEGIKSHLCEVAIPVMLHCISLPCGSDIFWKLIRDEFHCSDWRTRFNAGKILVTDHII